MSRAVSNVNILTDTVEGWVLQTNELLYSLSTEMMTANSTVASTGNSTVSRISQLWGTFGANTVVVTNAIQGGNVNGLSADLIVSSNLVVSTNTSNMLMVGNSTVNAIANSSLIKVANSTSSANLFAGGLVTGIINVNTSAVAVGANLTVNSSTIFVGNSTANSVYNQSGATVSNSTVASTLTVGSLVLGNSTVNSSSNSSILKIANSTSSSNVGVGSVAIGNSTVALVANSSAILTLGTLTITNATSFSNTISVTGAATLANTLAVTGTTTLANTITIKTEYVIDVSANADVGSSLTPTLVYSFPKFTYSTAKLQVQVKKGTNTQITEILVAHDGTTAYSTSYGDAVSPSRAGKSTFSANINSNNVELLISQEYANSAVKVLAHLIK